jgi:hypothetical protein
MERVPVCVKRSKVCYYMNGDSIKTQHIPFLKEGRKEEC